jgi:ATP/maltotriose-dependent transcriptional regulator MalT
VLVIGACDHARDYERALQWSERFKQVEHSWRVDGMFSICRPHYALVLIQHGRWADAEHELEEGIRVLTRFRPPMARESLVRLAELRWRQGKSDAARALFLAAEADGLSLVGRAEMALGEGDPETAVDLLNRNLRHVSANNRLERVAGLGLLVAAALAVGDQAQAETAMHDLMDIAEVVGTAPLKAAFLLAQGRIAKHSKAFEDAADLFGQRGATYDCARARIELAQVLLPLDRAMQAIHEAELAIAALRPMGAKRDLKRAVSVLNEARSAGAPRKRGITDGLTAREGEVLLMLASGRSNQEIAEALTLSLRTVERYVSNIYGKVGGGGKTGRAAATAYAYQQGLL